ncbi:dihydroorotase [Pontibacter diazotrophicus]|uniref:Dihydroorotase n=1 Tax=Pontibacter diazotrophicus TaxID=1400979 RepID=A0A3D8L3E0_9BACT|nr:dihydroorotase [Pontibacter diazotrophicus]RDV11934.1 dihydroorotase [Pontibacter diazotrophicus]
MKTIIRNANVVNEGRVFVADVLIAKDRIEKVAPEITSSKEGKFVEINAEGLYLIPGAIDDQVHFRDPGLTQKADIFSESKAAVAGGVTSFMDMPNTVPNTLTQELLEEKYGLASEKSLANYSFFMGIGKDNLEEALRTDTENVCGITDDGLYFHNEEGILANYPVFLEKLFSRTETLVALHSENDSIIKRNTAVYRQKHGDDIPFDCHPLIRSEEACVSATKGVLQVARKHNTRLHLFHISTLAETELLDNQAKVREKRITAEACIHHLWFSDNDYHRLGAKIKWNPSIKTERDREGLLQALLADRLDIIATDHAPHTVEEKSGNYFQANSGGPLVQHALPAMLELYHQGKISLEKIVEKMSHHVAEVYRIRERGYIREGYFADLVLVDLHCPWKVSPQNLLYKCNWSPFLGQEFNSKITHTFVNGDLMYAKGQVTSDTRGKRLKFEKIR